jgi:hypothetical protein
VENDYADFRHLEHDEDLASLRPLAEYKDLLARKEQIQRARAERIRDALRQRLGGDYIVEIDHADKLVFATNVDRATLEELKTRLTACARCLWRDLLDNRFEQYVTVVIPSLPASAAMVPPGSGGYYDHGRRTLVAAQVGMVLVHEFVHALHSADQEARGQVHPVWIQEGLATLFESSRIEGDGMVPQPNLRLNLLKSLIARKQDIPFREFFRYDQGEFMKRAVVCYPQGRYIMMYLFEKGLLKKWYDAYTSSYQTDATGTAAMEKVFGEDLSAVQRDWLAWVQAKTPPAVALPARHAYIGVRTMGQTDGLRVLEVVPGSGAERAGLKVGDVIIHLDGARVVEPGELVQMIDRHNVGDGVQVRFRRDGQYRTVTVVLQEMPEGLSLRMPPTAPSTRPASSPAGRPARRPPRTLPTSAPASRKAA